MFKIHYASHSKYIPFVASIAQIIKNSGGTVPDYMLQMKKVRKSEAKMRAKKPLEREDISTKIKAEKLPLPRNLDKPEKAGKQEKHGKLAKAGKQEKSSQNNKNKLKNKSSNGKDVKSKTPLKGKLKQNKKNNK